MESGGEKKIDNVIKRIWHDIDLKYKLTFLVSLIIGVLTHGMALFNKFAVHDEAAYYLFENGMTDWWLNGGTFKAGRWMLGLIGQTIRAIFGDNISTSTFAGLVSIICLSLSACIIIYILPIKSTSISVIIGCLMVTCPVITGLFGFMYIAPQYLLGLLIGFIGTWLVSCNRTKLRWIIGIILMGSSVGVYQAFIPCMLSLMLFRFIKDFCFSDKTLKETIHEVVYYCISTFAFMAVYFVFNQVFLKCFDFELIEYKGVNSMMDLHNIPTRFINAFKYFFTPDGRVADVIYPMTIRYVYYLCIVVWALAIIIFLLKKKYNKDNIWKKSLASVAFLLVPFCTSFIYLECDEQYVVGHMAYGQIMFFIYILFIIDYLQSEHFKQMISRCSVICLSIT